MCHVHTERFYWLCAHYAWVDTIEDNGSCWECKQVQAYRQELWCNFICPSCQGSASEHKSKPAPVEHSDDVDLWKGEEKTELVAYKKRYYRTGFAAEAGRVDWKRREGDYNAAFLLYQRARLASMLQKSNYLTWGQKVDPELKAINTLKVPPRSIPLRTKLDNILADTHLLDKSEFISPDLYVVPPGNLPPDEQICGICWGSLLSTDEEACEGGPPRMLPCSHIFGQGCVSKLFNKHSSSCPYRTREYRVVHCPEYDGLIPEAIDNRIELPPLHPRIVFVENIILLILSPLVLAVTFTMKVGPPFDGRDRDQMFVRGESWLRKLFVIVICLFLSLPIYGCAAWAFWSGQLGMLDQIRVDL